MTSVGLIGAIKNQLGSSSAWLEVLMHLQRYAALLFGANNCHVDVELVPSNFC